MLSSIVRFLSRENARETWWYERAVIVAIEALCLVATLAVTPWGWPALIVALRAPIHIRKTATDHAARSGAARKRELAETLGLEEARLACARSLEHEALVGQVLSVASPLIDVLAAAVIARSAGKSLEALAVVGCVVSLVRFALPLAYGAWRRTYRKARPIDPVKALAEQLAESGATRAAVPVFPARVTSTINATISHDGEEHDEGDIEHVETCLACTLSAAPADADRLEDLARSIFFQLGEMMGDERIESRFGNGAHVTHKDLEDLANISMIGAGTIRLLAKNVENARENAMPQ